MKELHDTTFMRTLSEMTASLLRETVDASRPRLGHFTRPFTDQEEYLSSCLVSAGEVSVACDQLHYALAYLSGYRARNTSDGELITRADYIAYQMENLYLRLGMIPDRSLHLTNKVFRLGLPARQCTPLTVTDNEHVRHTAVRARLRAIDKIVQPYRQTRNKIAHFQRFNDSDLSDIEGFFILKKSEGSSEDPVIERYHHFYKREADSYVDSRRSEFVPIVSNLINAVASFYETLLTPFKKEHDALG